MISTKPAWAYRKNRHWKAVAVDFGIALATVLYLYAEWYTGDSGGLQYGIGVVSGYVILRGRDITVKRLGWVAEADE